MIDKEILDKLEKKFGDDLAYYDNATIRHFSSDLVARKHYAKESLELIKKLRDKPMDYESYECYDTPYGVYKIGIIGVPYKKAKSVDNTPVCPCSPVNTGGFDILHDNDFIVKCETLDDARDCLKDIVLKVHRFKIVDEPKIVNVEDS